MYSLSSSQHCLPGKACISSFSTNRRLYLRNAVLYVGQERQDRGSLWMRNKPLTTACVAPAAQVSKIESCEAKALTILDELKESCATPVQRLTKIIDSMIADMHAGLQPEGESSMKMIITFVDNLPSGDERGLFYALDLGGTNFRVLRVQLGGDNDNGLVAKQEYEEISIPPKLMIGTAEELFDFIATKLRHFVLKESEVFHPLPGQKRELGFTFSFPVKQTSIDSGILIKWTKGFAVNGVAGKDVVQALNEALGRQGLDMRVSALVNDTVGTLAVAAAESLKGCHHTNTQVLVSVILGTGTNACYVEHVDSIPKWQGPKPRSSHMVINMEWGGFSCPHLPMTQYDYGLDADSINPGEQIFEKLLSGMYLGDVVRRVLLRMAKETALFGETVPSNLMVPFILGTPLVSAMHQDVSSDLQEVGRILEEVLGVKGISLEVRKLVLEVCSIITERAARLAGAGIVGILKKIGKVVQAGSSGTKTVVAMDGGLYEHYPLFRQYLKVVVSDLLGEEAAKDIVIELSKDGSGIGAALLAAAHSRYQTSRH